MDALPLRAVASKQQPVMRNILLVDPDPQSVTHIKTMLNEFHSTLPYRFQCVECLDIAIAATGTRRYDLILLDIDHNLPNLLDLLKALRDMTKYSPIIVMTANEETANEDSQQALRWMEYGVDDCIEKKQLNGRILTRMIDYSIARSNTYLKLQQKNQDNRILNTLLQLSLSDLPIEPLLQRSLEIILSANFTNIKKIGAIFLTEEHSQQLKMVAQVNLPDDISQSCAKVAFGECLCGQAAEHKKLRYVNQFNAQGNCAVVLNPKGLYSIPIMSKSCTLGVLVLYLNDSHRQTQTELEFIHSIADTLAGIIERSNALIRLKAVHEQNSRVLASITSILIGVDDTDRISHWNQAAEEYFGFKADEVIGKPIVSLSMPWDWAAVSVKILDCMVQNKKVNYFDVRFRHPEGESGLLSFLIMPFIGLPGSHSGYLMIGEDVTEQKAKESQRLQQQKLQTIGQLAAGIAHEINTPIQYVGDNIQFLTDVFQDYQSILDIASEILTPDLTHQQFQDIAQRLTQQTQEMDLSFIQTEIPSALEQSAFGINHVSKIVAAMKDFSHPGSEKKIPSDLNQAVENTVTITSNVWKYYCTVELDLQPDIPRVDCVLTLINEVIVNIIVNAVDAIKEVVKEDDEEKGRIKISSQVVDERYELRIQDSGSGIPQTVREQVFDPFFTTKEVGYGTGQGLSLSHSIIVDRHQGEIYFETEMGVGTTFIIHLPIRSTQQ